MTPEPIVSTSNSPAEICTAIQRTRHRLDDTVDELMNRLSPASLLDSALSNLSFNEEALARRGEQLKRTAKKSYSALATHVKHHPGPTLLLGAGVLWMLFDHHSDDGDDERIEKHARGRVKAHGVTDTSYFTAASHLRENPDAENYPRHLSGSANQKPHGGESNSSIKETITNQTHNTMDTIKDKASSAAETASEWTSHATERTKEATHSLSRELKKGYIAAEERYERALESHPLAIGAGALAIGLLASLALPRTKREDRFMGEASDDAYDSIKRKGNDFIERGKHVADEVKDHVKHDAKEAGRTSVREIKEEGQTLADRAEKLASSTMDTAKKAAKEEHIHPNQVAH